MSVPPRKAVIIGAGISGLATATILSQRGWNVSVFEQAAQIKEVGAGLQISPNGCKILDRMGLLDQALAVGFLPEAIELYHGQSGKRFCRLGLGADAKARWGAPYLHIHRADLHAILLTAARDCGATINAGVPAIGITRQNGEIAVEFDRYPCEKADLVIGADGVHSIIRSQIFDPSKPRYSGSYAWRTTVPADRLGPHCPPPTAAVWTGPGKHAVTTRLRQGSLVNFVAIVDGSDWTEESWSATGHRQDIQAAFGGWNPILDAVLDQAEVFNRWALLLRDPLEDWASDNCVLIGDAAHPMLPSLAQGAVQGLEDAAILAALLDHDRDIPQALKRFVDIRRARVARVTKTSHANLRLFHRRGLPSQLLSYGPIAALGALAPGFLHRRYDWLYGYEAGALVSPLAKSP